MSAHGHPPFSALNLRSARASRKYSIFLRRIVGVSLTTSAMSRHTFSVQAAGAGSHKPKSWRRRPWLCRRSSSMSTLDARSMSLHHDGVCTKHLFGHLRTMMTRANSLRSREAGRPINVSVTQGPTPTRASPHTPPLRLPRQATTAEFRIVDLIAQHDPQPNPQLPRRRDVGLRESLLRQLASIEALQVRIPSDGMSCCLTPEEPQERIALFGERAQSLPLAARVLARDHADVAGQRFPVEKPCGIAHEDFRR